MTEEEIRFVACNLEYKNSKLPGYFKNLKDQIRKYNIEIAALQEI
jgi:hypothetical protein